MYRPAHTARCISIAAAVVIALFAIPTAASAAPAYGSAAAGRVTYLRACPALGRGQMSCQAIVDSNASGSPLTAEAAGADGLHPFLAADLQAAYKLPSALLGERQTVAIVDAYDDPNAESDLAAYRAANNLPTCTTANNCFVKVNQDGQQGSYPATDASWALEESLDVDMVSAACPNCNILLVEANTDYGSDLFLAEDEAAALGANVISNSWGNNEYNGEASDCNYFNHPGVAITVATGDSGFGVTAPAACSTVIAVGGTTLYQNNSSRGWAETAWSGSGSGCSAYVAKPAWQRDRLCGTRTVADVSAVSDPDTPVAVYDSYGDPGWVAVGGTSVASPLVAASYALAGNTATITPGRYLYTHHKDLFDVIAGSNGSCGGAYLCTAVKGYDGPTGWGTPDGIGAF